MNIPSYIVRLDSQKHIDFSLKSPYGGGRAGKAGSVEWGNSCDVASRVGCGVGRVERCYINVYTKRNNFYSTLGYILNIFTQNQ